MKFLVLALCVCAAHAASVRGFSNAKPFAQAQASVQSAPVVPQAVVRSAAAVGQTADVDAPILRSDSDVRADGFNYAYETGNGIVAESSGSVKNVDNVDAINVQGSYRYVSPEGVPVAITYIADENGYQPQGDHLPVSPPIPEAILRSLEYIRTHTENVPSGVVASASAAYKRV